MTTPYIASDTSPQVFDLLVVRWRSMSPAEKAELVEQINADVELMARAGIRAMTPELSERQVRHELARRRFGAELADEAFRHSRV